MEFVIRETLLMKAQSEESTLKNKESIYVHKVRYWVSINGEMTRANGFPRK